MKRAPKESPRIFSGKHPLDSNTSARCSDLISTSSWNIWFASPSPSPSSSSSSSSSSLHLLTQNPTLKACFSGGMFGLGAAEEATDDADFHLQVGEDVTETCWVSYHNNPSGLGAEAMFFDTNGLPLPFGEPHYLLRPGSLSLSVDLLIS